MLNVKRGKVRIIPIYLAQMMEGSRPPMRQGPQVARGRKFREA